MNEHGFLLLIGTFKDKLYRLAKRLLVSKEEAEDATQEIVLKLWKQKENPIKNYEAWAMTLMKNYCLDQLKAKKSSLLRLDSSHEKQTVSLEKQIETKSDFELLTACIDKLNEKQRIILHLREIEGYEFHEIVPIVNMNETAIRVSLSRARKIIREDFIKNSSYDNNKIK